MGKKAARATKSKIVSAAWKLFYEQGYEDTTVDEIIEESGTSKGSFYHYFDGKDALLGSLAYLFDEKYAELEKEISNATNCIEALSFLNRELFEMIENTVDADLLTRLLSSQLITKGEKHLLDRSRYYYKLLRRIVLDGQNKGEITSNKTVGEIVKLYALAERGVLYDWCLCGAEYSLREYGQSVISMILEAIRA